MAEAAIERVSEAEAAQLREYASARFERETVSDADLQAQLAGFKDEWKAEDAIHTANLDIIAPNSWRQAHQQILAPSNLLRRLPVHGGIRRSRVVRA